MHGFQILTVFALAALLVAEHRDSQLGKWIFKPIASIGFVGAAWTAGALGSAYGQWVLLALLLSWSGDVLLIVEKNQRVFQAGLVSFLLGHVAFGVAFLVRGVDAVFGGVAFILLIGPSIITARWLIPKLPREMRVPVGAYIAVITVMVVLAVATYGNHKAPWIPSGAFLFYLSDLSVARDRFVHKTFVNRLFGLPLYYGAQLLLAMSVL